MCATCLRTCVNNRMDIQWAAMYLPARRSDEVRWRAAEVCRQSKELQAKDKTVLRIVKESCVITTQQGESVKGIIIMAKAGLVSSVLRSVEMVGKYCLHDSGMKNDNETEMKR